MAREAGMWSNANYITDVTEREVTKRVDRL